MWARDESSLSFRQILSRSSASGPGEGEMLDATEVDGGVESGGAM
jgi:hypothetical protein